MRALKRSKRKFESRVLRAADQLLREKGYDLRALASHPLDTLSKKPVISGARIQLYLDEQEKARVRALKQQSSDMDSQEPKKSLETSDSESCLPDDETKVGMEIDPSHEFPLGRGKPVRMQGSWPQYPTPETQREYAENRWHGNFPMTRSAFSAQPQQLRDELMWIFGAESFADLVEKHPAHFYNGLGGARSQNAADVNSVSRISSS